MAILFGETIQVNSTSVSRLDEDSCSSDGTDDWDTVPTRSLFHLLSFHIKVENWGEHFDCPVCAHMWVCVSFNKMHFFIFMPFDSPAMVSKLL